MKIPFIRTYGGVYPYGGLSGDLLEELLDLLFYVCHVVGGLEAGYDVAFAVDEELGEVPLDVGLLGEVGISLGQHVVEQWGELVALVEAFEAFLLLEPGVERHLVGSIHVSLGELGEFGAVGELAELGDFLVGSGCLLPELVAGEIQDFEPAFMEAFVHGLEGFVLGSEAAAAGGVDNEQYLSLELGEAYFVLLLVLYGEVVDCLHCFLVLGYGIGGLLVGGGAGAAGAEGEGDSEE